MANWFEQNAPTQVAPAKKSWFASNSPDAPTTFGERFQDPEGNVLRQEARIAKRPDILKEALTQPLTTMDRALPMVRPMKALGGVIQRGTAMAVNPMIALQQTKPENVLPSIAQGFTGKRLGEVGDIGTGVGMGEKTSAAYGLGTEAMLTTPEAVVGAFNPKNWAKAGKYVGETAERIGAGFKGRVPVKELLNRSSLSSAAEAQKSLASYDESKLADLEGQYKEVFKNSKELARQDPSRKVTRIDLHGAVQKTAEDIGLVDAKGNLIRQPQGVAEVQLHKNLTKLAGQVGDLNTAGGLRNANKFVQPEELEYFDRLIRAKGGNQFDQFAKKNWIQNSEPIYRTALPDLAPVRDNWRQHHEFMDKAGSYFRPDASEGDLGMFSMKKGETAVKNYASGATRGSGEGQFLENLQERTGNRFLDEPVKLAKKLKRNEINLALAKKAGALLGGGALVGLGFEGARHFSQ